MPIFARYEILILAVGVGISLITGIYSIIVSRKAISLAERALDNEKCVHSLKIVEGLIADIDHFFTKTEPIVEAVRRQATAKLSGVGYDHREYVSVIADLTNATKSILKEIHSNSHLIGGTLSKELFDLNQRDEKMRLENNADDFWQLLGDERLFVGSCREHFQRAAAGFREKIVNI